MTSNFLVNSRSTHILFDFNASDSFVPYKFAYSFQIACYAIVQSFHIDNIGNISLLANKAYRVSIIGIESYNLPANLIPIFDIILDMDWLLKNHAELLCYKEMICIPIEREDSIYVYGENNKFLS